MSRPPRGSRRCIVGEKTAPWRSAPSHLVGGKPDSPAPAPSQACLPGSSDRHRCGEPARPSRWRSSLAASLGPAFCRCPRRIRRTKSARSRKANKRTHDAGSPTRSAGAPARRAHRFTVPRSVRSSRPRISQSLLQTAALVASSTIVTGPSLASSSRMRAPKTPVSTGTARAPRAAAEGLVEQLCDLGLRGVARSSGGCPCVVSAMSVNWLTTSAAPPVSRRLRSNFPSSFSKMRRRAIWPASRSASAASSPRATPRRTRARARSPPQPPRRRSPAPGSRVGRRLSTRYSRARSRAA